MGDYFTILIRICFELRKPRERRGRGWKPGWVETDVKSLQIGCTAKKNCFIFPSWNKFDPSLDYVKHCDVCFFFLFHLLRLLRHPNNHTRITIHCLLIIYEESHYSFFSYFIQTTLLEIYILFITQRYIYTCIGKLYIFKPFYNLTLYFILLDIKTVVNFYPLFLLRHPPIPILISWLFSLYYIISTSYLLNWFPIFHESIIQRFINFLSAYDIIQHYCPSFASTRNHSQRRL